MNIKKLTSVVSITLALIAGLLIGASRDRWVGDAQTSITTGLNLPNRSIYALTSDNAIYVLAPGTTQYTRLGRVNNTNGGNLIGIDFRPSDKKLYGLTDTGNLYTIDVSTSALNTTFISSLNPRFTGGFGSLMDFNPVLDALRV